MPIGSALALELELYVTQAYERSGTDRAAIHEEIVRFLVYERHRAARDPSVPQADWIRTIPFEGRSPPDVYRNVLTDEQRAHHDALPVADQHAYLYFHGANFMWDTVLPLSDWGENAERAWDRRWEPQSLLPEVTEQMPSLAAFLEALPFQRRGRVLLLGVSAFQPVYEHRDDVPHLSEFMLVSFMPESMKKHLCVRSSNRVERFPVMGTWFDEADAHHVEPSPWFNYTIRVDGELRDDVIADVLPPSERRRLRRIVAAD